MNSGSDCVMTYCSVSDAVKELVCAEFIGKTCIDSTALTFEHPSGAAKLFEQFSVRDRLSGMVESQTMQLLERILRDKDRAKWNDPEGRKEILALARTNFGNNPYTEIFNQKFDGLNSDSEILQYFLRYVANAQALDVAYNARGDFFLGGKQVWPAEVEPDEQSSFFFNGPLEKGVRDRYRIVKFFYKLTGGGKTLSVACGSAQPLISAVEDLVAAGKGDGIKILLTDSENSSLELAKLRARQAGIESLVEARQMNIAQLRNLKGDDFDVIEICGLFDYFDNEYIVKYLKKFVLPLMNKSSKIIASGMNEVPVYADWLRRLYNWEVIYRPPEVFGQLLEQAGLINVRVLNEPHKIYYVAMAEMP